MAPSNVVLLLIGLHGAGKSTFTKAATGQDVEVHQGGGLSACTMECNKYTVDFKQKRFTIIDTPGLADKNTMEQNLEVLQQIADQLQQLDQERVNGVIYFHSIEGARLSGIDMDNIRILKKICGEEFFPRVAFVTTRWDRIKVVEWPSILEPRNRDLESERKKLLPNGPGIFKFLNDGKSHEALLDYFGGLDISTGVSQADARTGRNDRKGGRVDKKGRWGDNNKSSSVAAGQPPLPPLPPQLLFAKELERYRWGWERTPERVVKKTGAGKEVLARSANVRKGICVFL